MSSTTNLTWGTEAARLAGVDKDLLSKVSTVFAPSDEVGGSLLN